MYAKLKKISGLTHRRVGELCGVSEQTAKSWMFDGDNSRGFPFYAKNLLIAYISLRKSGIDLFDVIKSAIIDEKNVNQWVFEYITGFCGVGQEGHFEIAGLNEMSDAELKKTVKNIQVPDYFFSIVDVDVVVDAVKAYRKSTSINEFEKIHNGLRGLL